TSAVQARLDEAGRREEALGRDQANLSNAREKFQAEQRELLEFKRSIDSRVSAVEENETEMDRLSKDVAAREARVLPEDARPAARRRRSDLDGQAKTVGASQLRLAQEKESLEAAHNERSQAILSREIELEAREQSLQENEEANRTQADENARRFGDLTGREESLEIEAAKADKVRSDLDARKADRSSRATELEEEAARLRGEEAKA